MLLYLVLCCFELVTSVISQTTLEGPCTKVVLNAQTPYAPVCMMAKELQIDGTTVPNIDIQYTRQLSSQNLSLVIAHNLQTTSISFPDLLFTQGSIEIYDNTDLKNLDFPMLSVMQDGQFILTANELGSEVERIPQLKLGMDSLTRVEELSLNLHHLIGLNMSNLRLINGDFHLLDSSLSLNLASLVKTTGTGVISMDKVNFYNVTFPQLEEMSGSLIFTNISGLSSFKRTFPKLKSIKGSVIMDTKVALDDYNSNMQIILGALKVAAPDKGNSTWTCGQIKAAYANILKGEFECSFPGDSISHAYSKQCNNSLLMLVLLVLLKYR